MTSRPLDVVIVGGGLAGLATAGYLREQHNVTVCQKPDTSVSLTYCIFEGT